MHVKLSKKNYASFHLKSFHNVRNRNLWFRHFHVCLIQNNYNREGTLAQVELLERIDLLVGIVYNTTIIAKELEVLYFDKADEAWLDFVAQNRAGTYSDKHYDTEDVDEYINKRKEKYET